MACWRAARDMVIDAIASAMRARGKEYRTPVYLVILEYSKARIT
jgi:hypothetical protein